jgi:hypothetical protein
VRVRVRECVWHPGCILNVPLTIEFADNEPILGVLGCPELPFNMSQPDGPKGQILVAVKYVHAVS